VAETIKMLPQKPDDILLSAIFLQVAGLSPIHAPQPGFYRLTGEGIGNLSSLRNL
jgi:hypothetical protein